MKFILLVEGKTDRQSAGEFLKRWLDPQLAKPVGISVSKFNGYGDLTNKMARCSSWPATPVFDWPYWTARP